MLLGGNCEDILPLTAELIPTLNCPCRCLQCSYRMQKLSCGAWLLNDADNPQWHMRAEDAAPLVRKLRDAGVRYLVVTGGGEPLMNSEATLAALLEGHEVGIETGLYTNGALLTKRLARAILKETPRFVRVSVNAGSEAVHSKYHRPVTSGPLFGQVQDGVKQLALYKAETGRKTEIGLSYIVNPVNYRDCAKFAEWVAGIVKEVDRTTGRKRSAIDFVRFTPTIDYFAETQHSQDFFDEAVALIQKDAVPLLEGAGLSVTLFNHRFNHIEERKAYDKCAGCFWFAEVAPDGSMYLCSELNFFPAYRIGSLLRNSVADIWASKDRREILSGVNGTRLRGCPPFCKADAINKVAAEIRKRCKITGERERIWQWLQDLHALHCWEPDTPFAKPKTVAF
ncbi:MAG: radical SAM/SPASM domain-containing protein [Verrucomicrobiota bacterium]